MVVFQLVATANAVAIEFVFNKEAVGIVSSNRTKCISRGCITWLKMQFVVRRTINSVTFRVQNEARAESIFDWICSKPKERKTFLIATVGQQQRYVGGFNENSKFVLL